METEYEAKFLNINKNEVRLRLKAAGATLKRPEFPQRRWVVELPLEKRSPHVFARVRDEGGIYTMTWKRFSGAEVDNPEEIELVVDSFDNAVEMLTELGCSPQSFQENRRGFDWDEARFCGVSKLYKMKYGEQVHIREMPKLTFDMPDPFGKTL